jgi:hypothetical protein
LDYDAYKSFGEFAEWNKIVFFVPSGNRNNSVSLIYEKVVPLLLDSFVGARPVLHEKVHATWDNFFYMVLGLSETIRD